MLNHDFSVSSRRISLLTLTFGMLVLFSACSSSGGGGGSAATLDGVSGAVIGYNSIGTSSIQAFAPNDGAQLVSGLVYPVPNSRVEGSLTALSNIPESSFIFPFVCNNVIASPNDLMTTGVVLLGVADSGGVYGILMRTNLDDTDDVVSVGATFHYYLVSSTSGSLKGTCTSEGITYAYDIDLNKGWNHVTAEVSAIDSFGYMVAARYENKAPTSNARWVFVGSSSLSVANADPRSFHGVRQLLERGLLPQD